jgi:hypothetical protein
VKSPKVYVRGSGLLHQLHVACKRTDSPGMTPSIRIALAARDSVFPEDQG